MKHDDSETDERAGKAAPLDESSQTDRAPAGADTAPTAAEPTAAEPTAAEPTAVAEPGARAPARARRSGGRVRKATATTDRPAPTRTRSRKKPPAEAMIEPEAAAEPEVEPEVAAPPEAAALPEAAVEPAAQEASLEEDEDTEYTDVAEDELESAARGADEAGEAGEPSETSPDEDAAVDVDEPDEDAPRLRHDEDLDPLERAALEAAAEELEETEEDLEPEGPPEIPRHRLDSDAVKVIFRLRRFGHEAYLVGGCVRDLLLSIEPKDFDVATSAPPEETRDVFTNCRLIGRRFRLAHIYFRGGKVVETATFRASPHEQPPGEQAPGEDATEDLYITTDNVYGTAEEDARRRDFTINGLFYDPAKGRVIDHVDGRADLDARIIRTIGNPDVRMREDPVRILRAVRFAAKLGFDIDPATYDAMCAHASEITRAPSPRVLEEVLRLLRSGASRGSMVLLRETGVLEVLLPPIAEHLETASPEDEARFHALLDAIDEWTRAHRHPPDDSVLLAALLLTLFSSEGLPTARSEALDDLLRDLVRDARLPRRVAERVRLVLGAQRIFSGQRKRRFSPGRFVRQGYIPDAMVLFDLRVRATGDDAEHYQAWADRVRRVERGGGFDDEPDTGEARSRRRRRGGRRRGGGGGGGAEGGAGSGGGNGRRRG